MSTPNSSSKLNPDCCLSKSIMRKVSLSYIGSEIVEDLQKRRERTRCHLFLHASPVFSPPLRVCILISTAAAVHVEVLKFIPSPASERWTSRYDMSSVSSAVVQCARVESGSGSGAAAALRLPEDLGAIEKRISTREPVGKTVDRHKKRQRQQRMCLRVSGIVLSHRVTKRIWERIRKESRKNHKRIRLLGNNLKTI